MNLLSIVNVSVGRHFDASTIAFRCGLLLLALSFVGCGTTSGFKTAQGNAALSLSRFSKVLVQDFADGASESVKAANQLRKRTEMSRVVRTFADMVAEEIQKKGGFNAVSRTGTGDQDTLAVGGQITRYQEGSAAARLLIGMGVGSSYFNALVEFRDSGNGSLLGRIEVDKNSWPLGGGIAATQTPEQFMRGAAKKVANELAKAKGQPAGR